MLYEFVSGRHPALSVIKNPRRVVTKVFFQTDLDWTDSLREIKELCDLKHIEWKEISRITLEKKFSLTDKKHQGVVIISSPYPYYILDEVIEQSFKATAPTFLLILDHIQDPQNLGALLRSAELSGCQGVIIPKDRACDITTTVVKTSAGASELIPVAQVANVNRTIEALQKEGITIIGLEETKGTQMIFDTDLTGPLALVVGNEGEGIKELTRKTCDFLMEIPMQGKTASLNASVAGGIAMFEVLRQRMK